MINHTSFLGLKSDQKYQILTKYAKRMCVFVFVYVQVRICEKWTKTKLKPTKRAREWKEHVITGSTIILFGASTKIIGANVEQLVINLKI